MAQQPFEGRNVPHSAEFSQRGEPASTSKFNEHKLDTEFRDDCVVHTESTWALSTRVWKKSTWKREKVIGTGAFGSVWLHKMQGEDGKQGGQLRAVKMLPRTHLPTAYLSQEVLALIKLKDYDHLFVKFLGWYESMENTFLTMEYIEHGDLSNYMLQEEKSQICVKEITRQILEGLEVLHKKDIFHRDLKPQNILIASIDPIWVKITDFGIAKRAKGTVVRTACGTEGYIAPELQGFLPREFNTRELLASALDIWSLGSLLHELLTSQTPFSILYEDSDSDTDTSVCAGADIRLQLDVELLYNYCQNKIQFPIDDLEKSQVDEEGIAFVKSLLIPNPKERPTASSALRSLWLQGYKSDWFEGLRDEFSYLGVDLSHKHILVRQAYKADILQFLPKDKAPSLLLEAVKNGYNLAVSKLLGSPSREPIDFITMQRLFRIAAEAKKPDTIKILLSNKSDSDSRIDYERLMELAVDIGHLESFGVLFEDKNAITSIDYQKMFLLAIKLGRVDITRVFLNSKINTCDPIALQMAVRGRHTDIVKLLLGKAGINTKRTSGQIAVQAAISGEHIDIIKLLLDDNVDVNAPLGDKEGRTALQAAVSEGNTGTIKLLLDNKADVNAKGSNGQTALQAAISGENIDIIKLLLNNVDVNAPLADKEGRTALQTAVSGGNIDIIKLVLENKANMDTRRSNGQTALQAAISCEHIDIIKLLLNNVDVNTPLADKEGQTALQAAVSVGNIDIVKLLLDNKADVNAKGSNGQTALRVAVISKRIDIIKLLLDNITDVSIRKSSSIVALEIAVWYGNAEIIRSLLDYNTDLNTERNRRAVLVVAARRGHTDTVKLLLENKAHVNGPIADEESCLMGLGAAAGCGHIDIVKFLLGNITDVNGMKSNSITALQGAVSGGHTEIVKLLLDNGADVNMKRPNRRTVLQTASRRGNTGMIKLLLDNKADVNTHTIVLGEYITALQVAIDVGRAEVVKLLLDNNADANAKEPNGQTALQAAALMGNTEIVKLLLDNGANVNMKGFNHRTALQTASQRGNTDIVKLLLDNKADVNAYIAGGGDMTALLEAVDHRYTDIVKLLLDNEADEDAKDPNGKTALQSAALRGHTEIVQLLLDKSTDMDVEEPNSRKVLNKAALSPNTEIFQPLQEDKTFTNATKVRLNDQKPLRAPVLSKNTRIARFLFGHKAGLSAPVLHEEDNTELQVAVDTEATEILFDGSGANIAASPSFIGLKIALGRLKRKMRL